MKNTKISWCTSTWNPWVGCTMVSAGCSNCYAYDHDLRWDNGKHWGKGQPRRRTSPQYWQDPERWNKAAQKVHAELERPSLFPPPPDMSRPAEMHTRVFCGSLCDWLDPEVPTEWLADLLGIIAATPHLSWLLLSKRPELWADRMRAVIALRDHDAARGFAVAWFNGVPPPQIRMGATVENRATLSRVQHLRDIPAVGRFLSCEPLLEDLGEFRLEGIGQVIAGGESGPRCRPMEVIWARRLLVLCRDAEPRVAFWAKQLGGYPDKRDRLDCFPEFLQHRMPLP